MSDGIKDVVGYALRPGMLLLYAAVFVGEHLQGVRGQAPFGALQRSNPGLFDALSIVFGPVNFAFDAVGFLLVALGTVAVLAVVVRDATSEGGLPDGNLPVVGGGSATEAERADGESTDEGTTADAPGNAGDGSGTGAAGGK